MWTGEVLMGSEQQAINVIFDNASDWLTVEGSGCINCAGNTFDTEASTTAVKQNAALS